MSESTQTLTLTDFLLARIADDEAAWDEAFKAERDAAREDGGRPFVLSPLMMRLPSECEAKRRIVEMHEWDETPGSPVTWASELRVLAAVYADHPDYRERWRP